VSVNPTSPNRQAQRSQHAREQIVQAALTVFALKGYTAASMDDICMAAACSKGGLYHHFPTKSAVLAGVVKRLAEVGAILPPFEAAELPSLAPSAIGRVLIEVWAEASRDDALRGQLRAAYEACAERSLAAGAGALAEILRIGALIQMLTRSDEIDAEAAARRLGIPKAA
jgi:AcrR family transcriptional regulator